MIVRECVRAILLTPRNEILLMRIHEPGNNERFWWITPGGGKEDGENIHEALRRELHEELGLRSFVTGPLVWKRQHTFNWNGKRICQKEQYFIVAADSFEPVMGDEAEMTSLDTFRWWPVAELRDSTERLTPLSLADIVTGYLENGAPSECPDIEILED
jgi:8-oxo-dGTP pyrophosphatase MutT (NUDIX family)